MEPDPLIPNVHSLRVASAARTGSSLQACLGRIRVDLCPFVVKFFWLDLLGFGRICWAFEPLLRPV